MAVPVPPVRVLGLTVVFSPIVLEAERVTVPEKLFSCEITMVDEPVLPALIFKLAGLAEIVKSCTETRIVAEWERAPLVPVMVRV